MHRPPCATGMSRERASLPPADPEVDEFDELEEGAGLEDARSRSVSLPAVAFSRPLKD